MRKYSLLIIVLFQSFLIFGQGSSGNESPMKTDLPTIVPPSPTVAGLMKFEEVPVSTYTGVPDISIPLFADVGNHGLAFNMSLNYSPSSIKKEEKAGYTGLGWSLLAGGTISRTIRDIPDEGYYLPFSTSPSTSSRKKIGLYHNDGDSSYDNNNYYDVVQKLDENYNYVINHPEDQDVNKFLFEVNEKQTFDSKHDLYQFNFMGYTGRFIIEKKPDGSFVVSKLDMNNLIISYNSNNKTFEIKDTKGFTYLFDVKELSSSSYTTISKSISENEEPTFDGGNSYIDVVSAFHLSKVFYNGELIIEFTYNNGYVNEYQSVYNTTRNIPVVPTLSTLQFMSHFEDNPVYINGVLPLEISNSNSIEIKTKKLKQIKIIGKAIIDLDLGTGRLDDNIPHPELGSYLHKVTIRDWNPVYSNSHIVKEYELNYIFGHKMFLNEITEGIANNKLSKYQFKYKDIDVDISNFDADYWGYYKVKDQNCTSLESKNREADKYYCSKDVLKQIIYPTKGSAIFEFESNTYSYIGDRAIPDMPDQPDFQESFEDNPDYWNIIPDAISFTIDNNLYPGYIGNSNVNSQGSKTHELQDGAILNHDRTFIFKVTSNALDNINIVTLRLNKKSSSGAVLESKGIYNTGCNPVEITLKEGFSYDVVFTWENNSVLLYNDIQIDEKQRSNEIRKYLYGGGIRIKNIYYTDTEAPELESQNFPNSFSRKIAYSYNFFDDIYRSSGSLVYPKPLLRYSMQRNFDFMAGGVFGHIPILQHVIYDVISNSNSLSFVSSKGSDVGYKNVTVTESGNGRTEYTYLSPIDYPEEITARNLVYPFAPTSNLDYKRGHLLEERKFNQDGRNIYKNQKFYSFVDESKITGVTTYYMNGADCPYAKKYFKYDDYYNGVIDPNTYLCGTEYDGLPIICGSQLNWNARLCGDYISQFVSYILLKEAFGWAKLDTEVSTDYFYDSNGNTSHLEKSVAYSYNPLNMQLSNKLTTYSPGNYEETKIYYPIDSEVSNEPFSQNLVDNNMIDTPLKIENHKNGAKLSEQKTIYKDWGGNLLLPEIIVASKGSADLEPRVRYTKYDDYGHPLAVQQENGTTICYIWGYHSSQPIAKIENATYESLESLVGAAQSASDTSVTGTESNLLNALQAIRTALPNAMVTTYTYKPLVGVSTITDPRGFKTRYEYDSFGRLAAVYDDAGNLLSSNDYHYRTQN